MIWEWWIQGSLKADCEEMRGIYTKEGYEWRCGRTLIRANDDDDDVRGSRLSLERILGRNMEISSIRVAAAWRWSSEYLLFDNVSFRSMCRCVYGESVSWAWPLRGAGGRDRERHLSSQTTRISHIWDKRRNLLMRILPVREKQEACSSRCAVFEKKRRRKWESWCCVRAPCRRVNFGPDFEMPNSPLWQ